MSIKILNEGFDKLFNSLNEESIADKVKANQNKKEMTRRAIKTLRDKGGKYKDLEKEFEDTYGEKCLDEDTVKQNGKWVNKGKEGTHGKFKTKKAADSQRKAMFANGYKAEELKENFPTHGNKIDLEKVIQVLWEKGNEIGGEDWIEVFNPNEVSKLSSGEEYCNRIEVTGDNGKQIKISLKTNGENIEYQIFNEGRDWKKASSIDELWKVIFDRVGRKTNESLRRKPMWESEREPEIKRYSDVRPRSERKYWYFTTHGVQPGSIPRDLNVLEVRDGQNDKGTWGTYVMLDGVLNTSELKKYDMRELVPPMQESKRKLKESDAPEDYLPKKQGKAYKVFRVKNGKLYPPMVANPGGQDTPIGKWLIADEGEFAGLSKTGRPQVKSSQGGTLSYRPGWHLGDVPRASQFDRTNKETGEKEFPKDFVWAECSYTMDVDYQPESDEQGYMRIGKDGKPYRSNKYQHSLAGLPKLPKDGYYKYRTNPRPDTVPWVITGAIKVDRLLSDDEVNEILEKNGIAPIHRQGGDKTLAELGLKESFNRKSIRSGKKYMRENKRKVIKSKKSIGKKSLKESKRLTESFDDMEVFMNTWANYNEYGADGVLTPTGWMSIDKAIEYCEEYAEYEPFINDTDNVPFDVSEYSNASSVLQDLKELQDSNVDEDVVEAIVEAGGYDVKEAVEIAERGDYYFYPDVHDYSDLAYAVIDEIGSLKDALGDRINNYIDEDQMRREYSWDIRDMMRDDAEAAVDEEHEGEDEDSYDREQEIEDWIDEHEDDYLDSIIDEEISLAEAGEVDLSNYFDYEAFGRDLSYDGYTFTDKGAILIM